MASKSEERVDHQDREMSTSTKSVQTETDDESSESSSDGEESDEYESSTDESDDDKKDDKKEDNDSSYSSSSDSEDENRQDSSDGSSSLSDDDEPKKEKGISKEDKTTVVHIPNGELKKEEKTKEVQYDANKKVEAEVQTILPDNKESSMQTTQNDVKTTSMQTSPRKEDNEKRNDKEDVTQAKEQDEPLGNVVPVEKVEKQQNSDLRVETKAQLVQTTQPDLLDTSMQTSQMDLKASSMQTSPRDTTAVSVQTSPRADQELQHSENIVLVENVEIQRAIAPTETRHNRKVGTQTKPLHQPIDNPLNVVKASYTAQTMTIQIEKDDTDTQTINSKIDKQTQTKTKRDRSPKPSRSVSEASISSSRRSSLPDRPSAPEPYVQDSEETEEAEEEYALSEPDSFKDDVQLLQKEKLRKKKLNSEKKEDLKLLKKLLKHHKLPRKPKKHPLSPDYRRMPKPIQARENVHVEKKPRPKSVPDDSLMCKTRMKTRNNSGRGVSLAAFRLYLYKIS